MTKLNMQKLFEIPPNIKIPLLLCEFIVIALCPDRAL